MVIYKYILNGAATGKMPLPVGFKPLTVQMQNNKVCLWAMVDPNAPTVIHTLFVIGTGLSCDQVKDYAYLGTVQDRGGDVWHVFIN